MKMIVSLLLLGCPIINFSQDHDQLTKQQIWDQFRQDRRAVMQQVLKLFNDDFEDDDFYKGDQSVEVLEELQDNGDIHIKIIPKSKNIQLDIQSSGNSITIKSDTKVEEETKKGNSRFQSFSSHSFQRSIGIPSGYKIASSKQIDKGWLFVLVADQKFKKTLPKKSRRIPVDKKDGEEII